jgi:hypothetical protein
LRLEPVRSRARETVIVRVASSSRTTVSAKSATVSVRDGLRKEHGFGADAHDVPTLAQRRDELAIEPVLPLQL